MSGWEKFDKSVAGGKTARIMRVSLNERGAFALNQKVFNELGSPKKIELFYDKANSLIGMKACEETEENGYIVNKQGLSNSWLVRAMAFASYYNLDVQGTIVFREPKLDGDMLVLDLKAAEQLAPRKSKSKVFGQ